MERSTTLRRFVTGRPKRIREKKVKTVDPINPMTPVDARYLLELSIAAHFLIRQLDKLKGKTAYSYRLRIQSKIFLAEIEAYTAKSVWAETSEDINTSSSQMEDLTDLLEYFMSLSLSLDHLGKGQLQLFYEHMQIGFNRFNIPLRFVDGELVKI